MLRTGKIFALEYSAIFNKIFFINSLMAQYHRGRSAEYRVIQKLRERGWYTVRSAGSKGDFDIVAFKGWRTILVQVKRRQVGDNEFERMVEHYTRIANEYNLAPHTFSMYLAEVVDGKVRFRTLWGPDFDLVGGM